MDLPGDDTLNLALRHHHVRQERNGDHPVVVVAHALFDDLILLLGQLVELLQGPLDVTHGIITEGRQSLGLAGFLVRPGVEEHFSVLEDHHPAGIRQVLTFRIQLDHPVVIHRGLALVPAVEGVGEVGCVMCAVDGVQVLRQMRDGDTGNALGGDRKEVGRGIGEVGGLRQDEALLEHAVGHVDGEVALQLGHRRVGEQGQQQQRQQT